MMVRRDNIFFLGKTQILTYILNMINSKQKRCIFDQKKFEEIFFGG